MDVFPLVPDVRYDYASRFGAHHKGTDIFAPHRSAVVAVEAGHAHADRDRLGGIVIYLTGESGTRYYYAHLDEVVEPLDETDSTIVHDVEPGEVIGFVGTTGNAAGKTPHLHFQMAPPHVGTIDPFPELRRVDTRLAPAPPATPRTPRNQSADAALGISTTMLTLLILWALTR